MYMRACEGSRVELSRDNSPFRVDYLSVSGPMLFTVIMIN